MMKLSGKRLAVVLLCFSTLLFSNVGCAASKPESDIPKRISAADVKYLKDLARDTWNCIDYMVDPNTQLPYDNMHKNEFTSVTNIGLYVASLSAAADMGFITKEKARERLEKMLTNMNAFFKWNGFTQSWNSVKNGSPWTNDTWLSTLDSGNLYAGLMVGRATFPELNELFSGEIDGVDWGAVYNADTKKLRFGYNFKDKHFGGDLTDLGADSRLACFLAIETGKAPLDCWTTLNRNMEERYGYQYFQPGWQGGGVFMQYISGLILEERHTYIGMDAANFAYAQILHAKKSAYQVWGWSACEAPSGEYLGMNALKDPIITPHASVLALQHYPTQVIANLKKLESLGARAPYKLGTESKAFGFRDSYDMEHKVSANNYLILDQCMLFLSLANFVDNGFVWKAFKSNPGVEETYKKIPDLQPQEYTMDPAVAEGKEVKPAAEGTEPKKVSVFELRDTLPKLAKDDYKTILEPNRFLKYFVVKGRERAFAIWSEKPVAVDGDLAEWDKAEWFKLDMKQDAEVMRLAKNTDEHGSCAFMWDDEYLYFAAKVQCDDFVFEKTGADIWKDDVIELYLSPDAHNFVWGQRTCFKIGFAASGPEGKPQTWAWFQDGPTEDHVKVASKMSDTLVDGKRGYFIEGAIEWKFLGITPGPAVTLGATPAIHFIDQKRENELKLIWSFLSDGKSLGELILKK